jgi:20S proteasome alpha/beta subunit
MTEIRTAVPQEVDDYLDALVRKGIFANKAELVRAARVNYVNLTGTFFRGFDAENIFAPDGRLYQLEYAREAALRGGTAIGIACEDGVLLAAEASARSKIVKSVRKIVPLGDRLAVAASGLVGDMWLLVDELKAAAPKSTDDAVKVVRSVLHRHTLQRTQRPLGVALLVASVLDRKPRLVEVDPSGATCESHAAALGRRSREVLEVLEERYRKMRVSDAERLVPDLLGRETPADVLRVLT